MKSNSTSTLIGPSLSYVRPHQMARLLSSLFIFLNIMPSFAVVGALNYIGRHVVQHLHTDQGVEQVIAVDRTIPQISHLTPTHQELFQQVPFRQCALMSANDLQIVLAPNHWDVVICCAHEQRFGLSQQAYELATLRPALAAAQYASQNNSLFIYIGNATRRRPGPSGLVTEESGPPTHIRTGHKYNTTAKTEDALLGMKGLKLVLLRVAEVYGPDSYNGMCHMFATARVYKELGEPFPVNLPAQTRFHTIHSKDVARACFHVSQYVQDNTVQYPLVYNLVDDGNTNMQRLQQIVETAFSIKVHYMSKLMCKVVSMILHIPGALDSTNEKMLKAWCDLLEKNGIPSTPVDIYLYAEPLDIDEIAIDGAKFKKETGFTCTYPEMTATLVQDMLAQLNQLNLFPQ
jgi:nucleoside-diphosphate-sugar epimerase